MEKINENLLLGAKSDEQTARDKGIITTSIIGILANVFLASFKVFVGIFSHSIAVMLDAVNNLSDAASSVITIVGTKLAGKPADKKHPFGYGRIEYLSAMIISIIILYAGITSFSESIKKIISPEVPDYTPVSLVIIAAGVVVKLVLGRFVKARGVRYHSESLVNSGEDAMMDSIISASTLVAAGLFLFTGFSVEAWLGALISLFIVKSGIEMLHDTLSEILGERAAPSLALDIKKTVTSFEDVRGAYDLVLNNYGPDSFNGSIHIEVPDTYTADKIDGLVRAIQLAVYKEHNVVLTAIGVYSFNTIDPESLAIRERISGIAKKYPHVLQMHGFYFNKATKTVRFDLVISFDADDRRTVFQQVIDEVKSAYPDFTLQAAIDTDYSEL